MKLTKDKLIHQFTKSALFHPIAHGFLFVCWLIGFIRIQLLGIAGLGDLISQKNNLIISSTSIGIDYFGKSPILCQTMNLEKIIIVTIFYTNSICLLPTGSFFEYSNLFLPFVKRIKVDSLVTDQARKNILSMFCFVLFSF